MGTDMQACMHAEIHEEPPHLCAVLRVLLGKHAQVPEPAEDDDHDAARLHRPVQPFQDAPGAVAALQQGPRTARS